MGKFLDSVKNKKVDNKNTSSTTKKVGKFGKSIMESKIKLDTLDDDLKSLNTTIEGVYNEWQPAGTMDSTKESIVSMQTRLNAYQEYAKLFGGEDITDLTSGYNSVLEDWDNLSTLYGQYKNADAYNTVKKTLQLDKQFSHGDGKGYSYDEVQAELKKYTPDSDEYKYLSEYTNYSDLNDFYKALNGGAATDVQKQIEALKAEKKKLDSDYVASGGYVPSSSNHNRPNSGQISAYNEWRASSSELQEKIESLENSGYYGELKKKKNQYELENKVDLYKPEYESKPDFEEKSKYTTTYNENKKLNIWTDLQLKYEDLTYEYINNVNGARDEIESADAAVNQDGNGYMSKWKEAGYDLLREDEIKIYNYKHEEESAESANKFLEDLQPVLDKRRTDAMSKEWEKQAETMPVISDLATVIMKPAGAVLGAVDDAVTVAQWKEYNPYSYAHAISNYVSDTRKYRSDDIAESTEGFELFGQNIPSFLYNTGMSIADSAYGVKSFGGFHSVLMGTSAFQDKAKEMVEAGEEQGVVWQSAATSGVAEMLFEHIGIDNLFKIKNVDSLASLVKNTLKQAGAEAFEEIGTEITNIIADDVIRGKGSELYKVYAGLIKRGYSESEATKQTALQATSQVAWAGIGGALSGAAMGGVTSAKNYSENKKTGAEIRGNERIQDVLNIASMSPKEKEAYKAYTRYAKKGITAENIKNAQVGSLFGAMVADAVATRDSKKSTDAQKAEAKTMLNRLAKMKTKNKAAKTENELSQTDEEGTVTPATREAVVNEHTKGMSDAEANLFRLVDDGKSNVADYADSFNLVVAMAQNDYTQDYILEHRGVLSTGQVNSIYQSVVTNPKMAQQKRLEALIQEQGDNLEIKGTIDDSVIDYGNTGAKDKVNWKDLHPNVKATVAYISGFATKVAGMDVQLVTNGREYGFTGQYDRQGNTMIVDITALTERVKSADAKGRKDNSRFVISTVAHEVTHWMEEKAPELYAQYDKMVMDALTSGGMTEAEVLGRRRALLEKAEAKRAEKEGRKPRQITDKEVRREVIARASEEMLALSEEGKQFFESLTETEQKRFVDKIKEVIQNIKGWINSVLSNLTSDSPEAQDLRALAKDLDAISKKWDEMLREAAIVNAAMKKEGINDEAIMESKVDVDTQNADIDRYTTKQYNDFGWVAVNKVLTGKELKKLYSQFAKVKLNKEKNVKNKLGEYLIPVGDRYGSVENLVYIKGTNKHPIIRQVVEIDKHYLENAENIIAEVMRDESTGLYYDAFEIYEAYARTKIFTVHKPVDYPAYSELKNEGARGRDGRKSYINDRERNNGTRVSESRAREVRSNDGWISYSDIDSDGHELSAEQQEFFKDSKVRDESGKLKVMYHGTPNAGFTKFRSGTYFTEHKWYADAYQGQGASSLGYKKTADNPDTYAVYLNIKKPFDTRNKTERDIFYKEFYNQWGTGTPLMESGLPDWLDAQDLQEFLEEKGYDYDGLILDEGGVGGYGDEVKSRGLSYVVFSPEQVKDVHNSTPTSNPDYRYSDIDTEYMDAVENGHMETARWLVYQAAVRAGYMRKMFHETKEENVIHVFDLSRNTNASADYGTPFGVFTKSHNRSVGLGGKQMELYVKVGKTFRLKDRTEIAQKLPPEYSKLVDIINAIDEEYGKKTEGIDDEFLFAFSDWLDENDPDDKMREAWDVTKTIEEQFGDVIPREIIDLERKYTRLMDEWGKKTDKAITGAKEWLTKWLRNNNYDSMELAFDNGAGGRVTDALIVLDPNQVKSADPITYDDNGNIIPLSKRFDSANDDIRYSDIDDLDSLNSQLKEKQNQVDSAAMELRKLGVKEEQDKLNAVLRNKEATDQDVDKALQEYANWEKESGYADASKKLSALKDEEKLIRREIQKVEDKLHDELKEQIAHWDEEDVKKYVAKAVRKYRTTTRLDKASYLVTTGSMLDFSDGQGYRVKDHREISEILDLPDYAEYSDGMIAFMNMGNIRLQTYGIDVSAMPNAKQFSTLRDIISYVMRENDEFSVDFSKTDGYSAGSVTYGKGTSASKIIADIKSFFETGVVPEEQSNIRDFLYSDIDVEVDIYEILGENKRLNKENKILRADFERLMERRKLEGQLTHGKQLNKNQLDIVAGHIRNLGNSTYSKEKLVEKLNEVYTHIATSDELAWDDLFARFYGIAEDVLDEAKPVHSPNEYYANIYKELRNMEISLSDEQKQYVKSMLGVDASKAFFGKIKITDKGMPLNSKWEELAGKYPNEFATDNDKDQVIALLEIYETAKELKEVVEEYDKVEQTRWLANEIYNQYWNVSPIRTVADKYDKQIKHLKFEHRTAMKELRDSYNERLEKQKKADREERSRIFKKLREDHIKELQEIRKSSKERLDKYKDEAARKTRIQSVTANALTLNEWLVKNSKDKHIHESMKGPVIALLNAIDFSSKRALGMWGGDMKGVPTKQDISLQKALSQVQKMMADASVGKEDLVLLYGHELDADIADMIESVDNIMRTVGDNEFILNKMTLDDLITLDNVVRTIKSAVTQMNKFHVVHHAKGIANLAQEEINHADKLGKAKVYKDKSLKAGARKLLAWKNINPYYAFKRFGTAGKKIFEAFQDGYDKFAFNIKEIIDFTKKTYTSEEVQEWEKEIKSFDVKVPATESEISNPEYEPQYQKIQMTVAQIMDLYLLNKRAAAKVHLLGGGIRVADIETKGNEVISQSEGVVLEQQEIDEIIKSLTPRQIEVADALSRFMNTTTTEWGNEVSMARFGYRAFGEKNYVPMQVDKNNLAVDDETEKNNSLFRLLNMSFTKSLTEGANNRLVISSIFDVFAQHTSDMAKYNALALPVLDAFRWYNYKEKGYKGDTAFVTKSVKQSIENAFGKDGQSYITTFLKDLNGQENTSRDTLGKGFLTKAKIAAVGANLRVALLQPTAYLRASANIAPKYLLKGFGLHKPKTAIDLAEKYCGMALWKSLGYFDTNVQKGVADQIKHAESKTDKAIELSMKGAEWGDKITFGYLWNAAELETREKRQDLKVGSDEYYQEVGKRLRDIIYSTQVVDSVMTRSEMMRSGDGWDKFLTTFASEPTISYSMLADAYLQTQLDARELGDKKAAIKKNSKHIARVVVAYTVTNLAAALVESGFDVLRDNDDDDEEDAWELLKLYFENFATNQSIVAKIPGLKDVVSIAQGFSSSRMDTQWMQTFANFAKQIVKLAQGDGSWGKTIKNGVQTSSYFSGLPFYNAYRDALAFIDWLTPEELDELLKDFY